MSHYFSMLISVILKNRNSAVFTLLCFGLIGCALLIRGGNQPLTPLLEKPRWPVNTVTLSDMDVRPSLSLFGKVEALTQVNLTYVTDSLVSKVLVSEGQYVKQGQTLITLDSEVARYKVDQLNAELASAQLELDSYAAIEIANKKVLIEEKSRWSLLKKRVDRQEKLLKNNAVALDALEQNKLELQEQSIILERQKLSVENADLEKKRLKTDIIRVESILKQARFAVDQSNILAPFSGVMSEISVSPGERIGAGQSLAEIFSPKTLQVRASLPHGVHGDFRDYLEDGENILGIVSNDDKEIPVKLLGLTSKVASGKPNVDALFSVDHQYAEYLAINQWLSLTVVLPYKKDSYAVPPSAVYDNRTVYTVNDGRLNPVDVKLVGATSIEGRSLVLLSGASLSVGIKVVLTRLPHMSEGLSVSIIKD